MLGVGEASELKTETKQQLEQMMEQLKWMVQGHRCDEMGDSLEHETQRSATR